MIPFTMDDFEKVKVKSERWVYEDVFYTSRIDLTSEYIIISERKKDKLFHLIRREDMAYIGDFGRVGVGPDEFLSVNHFSQKQADDQVIFFSGRDLKLVFYSFPPGLDKEALLSIKPDSFLIKPEVLPEVRELNFMPPNSVLGVSNGEERFLIKDLGTGEITGSIDNWEGLLPERTYPKNVMQSIFQGHLVTDQKGQYIGHSKRHWAFIEIYNTHTGEWLRLHGPEQLEHRYIVETSSGYPMHYYEDSENKIAYYDLTLGKNYIYALYSGMQSGPHPYCYATQLLVFDYEGRPQKAYELDVKVVYKMAIDEENNMVYLPFTEGDNGGIARFQLDLP